ncbi:ECF transporter S component [Schleiferilactobacillus shenzhenensis]|uniref:Riboflavin transporter n=1 Tax=Schleiferilactobacillus shenzhenensis LY-73 TaxID=1231336 RepID=U4TQR5_9LACO|nr:ECF transporter S component [Schleiferilactobacillus shenzhenensis]ERL66564.1 hypothetical protein L248_0242 [Schleiferilactobacillus shenzhenensis LY-73]
MQANRGLEKWIGVAIFGALATLVMYIEIPIMGFLKLDVSDVVVLLAMSLYGLGAGIGVAAVKVGVHFVLTGAGVGSLIGDSAAFIAAIAFTVPLYFMLSRRNGNWPQRILAITVATLSLTVVMAVLNWLVLIPLYAAVMHFGIGMALSKYILTMVVPFNLLKGVVLAAVFLPLYFKLVPWVMRHRTVAHSR